MKTSVDNANDRTAEKVTAKETPKNYYGVVYVTRRKKGRRFTYFMGLDDFDGPNEVEISSRLYRAFKAEFPDFAPDARVSDYD